MATTMASTQFPTPNLPRYHLTGAKPTKKSVETFCKAIYGLARGKLSNTDPLGHLGLVVTPATYASLSPNNVAYVEPQQPAALNLEGTTADIRADLQWQYKNAQAIANTSQQVKEELRDFILASGDVVWIEALEDAIVGYGIVTPLQLLTHLRDEYMTVEEADRVAVRNELAALKYEGQTAEALIAKITKLATWLDDNDSSYIERDKCDLLYSIMMDAGLFAEDTRRWRRDTAAANKTWANISDLFKAAVKDLPNSATSSSTQFANLAMQHDAVTAALASNTAALQYAQEEMANLAHRADDKDALNTDLKVKLAAAVAELKILRAAGKTRPAWNEEEEPATHYCHTHGHKCTHPSHKCPDPSPAHKRRATKADPKGGSSKNK